MRDLFDYLVDQESKDHDFMFDRSSDNGLVISYPGYKHMNLFKVRTALQQEFKLRFDFSKGYEKFDSVSGRTFCYFKNVYKEAV